MLWQNYPYGTSENYVNFVCTSFIYTIDKDNNNSNDINVAEKVYSNSIQIIINWGKIKIKGNLNGNGKTYK